MYSILFRSFWTVRASIFQDCSTEANDSYNSAGIDVKIAFEHLVLLRQT